MTVRELIQELLLNCSLDDEIELEVNTNKEYNYSVGYATTVVKINDHLCCITEVGE